MCACVCMCVHVCVCVCVCVNGPIEVLETSISMASFTTSKKVSALITVVFVEQNNLGNNLKIIISFWFTQYGIIQTINKCLTRIFVW